MLMYFAFLLFEDKVMRMHDIIGIFEQLMSAPLSYITILFMVVFVYVWDKASLHLNEYREE